MTKKQIHKEWEHNIVLNTLGRLQIRVREAKEKAVRRDTLYYIGINNGGRLQENIRRQARKHVNGTFCKWDVLK